MKFVVVTLLAFFMIYIIIRRKNSSTASSNDVPSSPPTNTTGVPAVAPPTSITPVTTSKPYESIDCFKDTGDRAIPMAEGTDPLLDGDYHLRTEAIEKCFQVAKKKCHKIFAVQDGGWCATGPDNGSHAKYGANTECANKKGGPWANDVYRILG